MCVLTATVRPECFDHTSCICRAHNKNVICSLVSHLSRGFCTGHSFTRRDVPQLAVQTGSSQLARRSSQKCINSANQALFSEVPRLWLGDLLRVLLASAPMRPALYLNGMNVLKKAIDFGVDSSNQRQSLLSWRCALVNGVGNGCISSSPPSPQRFLVIHVKI
jgi:hypothetical protein